MEAAGDRVSPRSLVRPLLLSVALTVVLYVIPYGRTVGWPLVLVSTLAHELGHGIAAELVGGDFLALRISSDASGSAVWVREPSRLASAVVAASGLIGPALVALAAFLVARRPRAARLFLGASGAFLVLLDALRVRNVFGFVFVALLAVTLLVIAARARDAVAQLVLVFLAVQLSLSVFSRADYLFARAAGAGPSDVAQMADALLLPYWVWGILCGAVSIAVLWVGLRAYLGAAVGDVATGPPRLSGS